jgi:hypothetical protein
MSGSTREGTRHEVVAAGAPAIRVRARRRASRAGLKAVPLFVAGTFRRRVYVAVGSMVDVAVNELGARLTQVDLIAEEPRPETPSTP